MTRLSSNVICVIVHQSSISQSSSVLIPLSPKHNHRNNWSNSEHSQCKMLSHPMKLFSEDNCHGKPPCHASSSEAHSQNSPCLPPGKGSHTGGNITVGKTTPQHEKSSRKPNFPQDLSQGVPRLVTSEQSQARDTRSYEVMTSRCIDAIHKSSSPHSSQEKISYLPSSEKRRATGSTPSKTVTQHPTLLRTPERGSAPMRDRSHSPHGKSLRPSNHPSLPQNAAIIVRAKGYEQQEHQKTHPKPTSEPNKGGYVASASHGNKKHFASHAASGGGVSDNGFSSGVGAFRSGKHTAGKGKGRALELIGTTPFPLAWGFGRAQRRAPGSPVHQRTLLQLLSCRKLEQFKPHEYYATKMPLSAVNVTRSHDFPFGDVRGKCQHWSDFTFENMLARFPFLNRTVEVPQELGM